MVFKPNTASTDWVFWWCFDV